LAQHFYLCSPPARGARAVTIIDGLGDSAGRTLPQPDPTHPLCRDTANTIAEIGCCSFAADAAAYAAFGPRFEKLWELRAPDLFVLK
jgi:hypothetical protein